MILARRLHLVIALVVTGLALSAAAGCRSTKTSQTTDREIQRFAEAAHESYSEGADAEAILRYRQAIKRAWLLDDPVEISHNAYNLAACLASVGRYNEARDWLSEARAEYGRSGESPADAWLLQAKIARQQGMPDEALAITQAVAQHVDRRAARGVLTSLGGRPKEPDVAIAPCGLPICTECGLPHLPEQRCCGSHGRKCREPKENCKQQCLDKAKASAVEVRLIRANLAVDAGDLALARAELEALNRELRRTDNEGLLAEAARVEGRIALLSMQPVRAGNNFDLEAELLRRNGNYREIPHATYDSAQAYDRAGMPIDAGDRFIRTSRILFARGEWANSLRVLDQAIIMAEMTGDADLESRISILFYEITQAVEEAAKRERRRDSSKSSTTPAEPLPTPGDGLPIEVRTLPPSGPAVDASAFPPGTQEAGPALGPGPGLMPIPPAIQPSESGSVQLPDGRIVLQPPQGHRGVRSPLRDSVEALRRYVESHFGLPARAPTPSGIAGAPAVGPTVR